MEGDNLLNSSTNKSIFKSPYFYLPITIKIVIGTSLLIYFNTTDNTIIHSIQDYVSSIIFGSSPPNSPIDSPINSPIDGNNIFNTVKNHKTFVRPLDLSLSKFIAVKMIGDMKGAEVIGEIIPNLDWHEMLELVEGILDETASPTSSNDSNETVLARYFK